MKVLIVTRGMPPRTGGVETVCGQLVSRLVEAGDAVTVLTYGGRRAGIDEHLGARIVRLRSWGDVFEIAPGLPGAIRRSAFDVCHVHNLHATVAPLTALSGASPLVVTTHYHGGGHSAVARLMHPPYRSAAGRFLRRAAAVTAVSRTEAALVWRDFGVNALVVPNGMDASLYSDVVRLPRPDGPLRLLVVSRLLPYKGVDTALRVAAELPGAVLTVLGSGPDAPRLRRLASDLGIPDQLCFLESRVSDEALVSLMGDSDVLLNFSAAEAFALNVLEGLATGLPAVVSNSGALAEWAERFPEAVIAVPHGDVAAAVAAVRAAKPQCQRLDLSAFTWSTIAARYREVYDSVAA